MFIMKILKKEEGNPKIKKYNSYALMVTFIGSRILWVGFLEAKVIFPDLFAHYDLGVVIKTIGEIKFWFGMIMLAPMMALIFLNLFWAFKLYRGYLKSIANQDEIADRYIKVGDDEKKGPKENMDDMEGFTKDEGDD